MPDVLLLCRLKPIWLSITLVLCGCGGVTPLPQQTSVRVDNASVKNKVDELYSSLKSARTQEIHIFAPNHYSSATDAYLKAAQVTQPDEAAAITAMGSKILSEARLSANKVREQIGKVLTARESARTAGAAKQRPDSFAAAETDLLKIAKKIEAGEASSIASARGKLIRAYRQLELASLKQNIVEEARQAIRQAVNEDIDDITPQTMRMAEEEMLSALSVLDADSSNQTKAGSHAERAIFHVEHARRISSQIKEFEELDYSQEAVFLWHQKQLAKAVSPLINEIDVLKPETEMIDDIRQSLARSVKERQSLEDELAQTKAQKESLIMRSAQNLAAVKEDMEQRLLSAQLAADAEKRRKEEASARYSNLQNLFSTLEADVYQQNNDILIRAHGFDFASGKSTVSKANFPLLSKIIKSIEMFPKSNIIVSGHTDNLGVDSLNLNLSKKRAQSVADYLKEVGLISKERILVEGFGESQPVANNETETGRSANRRVEILIKNQTQEEGKHGN